MNQTDIESNLSKFFSLIKDVPQVKFVKVEAKTITLEFLTLILVDIKKTSKVSDLLEFRVDKI